jgi:PIN domain nuclease of toxin-antitoxin system
MVILDTCAVIEICKAKNSLSAKTYKKLEGEGACILSVSFAEIACKIKIGKLDIGISVDKLYSGINSLSYIDIVKIGVEEWIDAVTLDWEDNRDPADRLIVSFAMNKKIPIVTTDKKINKFYREVIW